MHTTNLRRVGGSVMLAVPPALLDILSMTADNAVGLTVENGRLIVEPQEKNKYTLNELLAEYKADTDSYKDLNKKDQDWLSSDTAGKELI